MRIVFFTENYYCGGLDTFLINLINYWPDDHDEIMLLCNKNHPGIEHISSHLNRPCKIVRHDIPTYVNFRGRFAKKGLRRIIGKILSPVLPYFFLLQNTTAIWRIFKDINPDRLMVVNGGYPGGDTCRAASLAWGLWGNKSHSIHNFHNLVSPGPWYSKVQERCVDFLLARSSHAFISVSRASAATMQARPVIWRSAKVSYIYNGVVLGDSGLDDGKSTGAPLRTELGLGPDEPIGLMLGTFEPRKGHEFLLEAFAQVVARVPDAHLVVCGEGAPDDLSRVQAAIKRNGLENHVHLLGFRQDVAGLMAETDILLIASQEYESFGLTAAEAMSLKVPVVATCVGGLPEVVASGEGGFCCDKNDVDGYAQRIIQILENPALREELGVKGYLRYQNLFTPDRMAAEYADAVKQGLVKDSSDSDGA